MFGKKRMQRKRIVNPKKPGFKWPEEGKKFKRENLTPLAESVYKRISQIYGIPLKELLPFNRGIHGMAGASFGTLGRYFPVKHDISLLYEDIKILDHELLHSADFLLNRKKLARIEKKLEKGEEFRGKEYEESIASITNKHSPMKEISRLVKGAVLSGIGSGLIYTQNKTLSTIGASTFGIVPLILLMNKFSKWRNNRYFRKYGADGLILLSAVPIKNYDIGKIRAYEREMVKNGILSPKGGLTKKGMRLVREKMPKGEIVRLRVQQDRVRRKAG